MSYAVEVCKNVANLRKEKKLSQEELAFESDISLSSFKDIEHGRANPSLDTLESLTKALDITLLELLVYHLEADTINRLFEELRQEFGLTEPNSADKPVISG